MAFRGDQWIKIGIKQGVGNLTGNQKLKGEGKADQVAGKIENTIGSAKDKIRETLKE